MVWLKLEEVTWMMYTQIRFVTEHFFRCHLINHSHICIQEEFSDHVLRGYAWVSWAEVLNYVGRNRYVATELNRGVPFRVGVGSTSSSMSF